MRCSLKQGDVMKIKAFISNILSIPFHQAKRPGPAPNILDTSFCRIKRSGFTLIELMLVVIIISVLVAMVVPRLVGRSQQARVAAAEAQIEAHLATALDLYELDNGMYPTTEQGLNALITKPSSSPAPPNWKGPYMRKMPLDPWGNPYVYTCPGVHNTGDYDLSSYGADGIESADDIVNWQVIQE
jgi:general secretion pathway protein G